MRSTKRTILVRALALSIGLGILPLAASAQEEGPAGPPDAAEEADPPEDGGMLPDTPLPDQDLPDRELDPGLPEQEFPDEDLERGSDL